MICILLVFMCGIRLFIFLVVVLMFIFLVCLRLLELGLMFIIYMGLSKGLCCSLVSRLVLMLLGLIRVYLIFLVMG